MSQEAKECDKLPELGVQRFFLLFFWFVQKMSSDLELMGLLSELQFPPELKSSNSSHLKRVLREMG